MLRYRYRRHDCAGENNFVAKEIDVRSIADEFDIHDKCVAEDNTRQHRPDIRRFRGTVPIRV